MKKPKTHAVCDMRDPESASELCDNILSTTLDNPSRRQLIDVAIHKFADQPEKLFQLAFSMGCTSTLSMIACGEIKALPISNN